MPRPLPARLRLGTALLALCTALACKPDKPVTPGAGGDGKGGTVGEGRDVVIAPVGRPAEMLPGNTAMFWEVAGPDRVAEIIGRDTLVQKFAPQYRELAEGLVRTTGRDLLDPRQLAEIGVDTKGRMGFALVSVQPMTFVAFASITDEGRMRQAVLDMAKRAGVELAPTPLGHAEILRDPNGRMAIVIRKPFVAVVVATGEAKQDLAFDIATMDPARSLASAKNFRKATGGLAPADAMAYFDGNALVQPVLAGMGEPPPAPTANWARDELAKARQDKAPPERIKELEAQAEEVDRSNARWTKRQQGEREMFEKILGGVQTSVWTADAKPGGVVGQGSTTFAPDSPLLLAFENGTGSPPLARALDGKPLLMLSAKANVEQLAVLFDLFAKADGTTWADVSAEIARSTGIDPDRDLKALVTGQVGFAITQDLGAKASTDLAKQLGMALHVEVHDPKGAKELLAKAAKAINAQKEGPKARKAGDGWVVDVPKWRKVHADVQGPHLVISTDPKLVGRIASGGAGSIAKSGDSAAIAAAAIQGSAASVLMDPALGLWAMLGRMDIAMSAVAESPEDAKVPKSRTWKAKEREVKAVEKKIEKAQRAREEADLASFRAVVEPWGPLAGHVKREGNTLSFQGGWFVRADGISGALAQSLEAVRKLEERKQNDDLSALFSEMSKLQNELQEIRRADIEKFRARKGR